MLNVKVAFLLLSWCEPVRPLPGRDTGENCHPARLSTPPHPSFTTSIPTVLPPLISSSFCFLFLFRPSPPSLPGSLATRPHPQHEKNMILTTLPETLLYCLSTHTHTHTIPSHLPLWHTLPVLPLISSSSCTPYNAAARP